MKVRLALLIVAILLAPTWAAPSLAQSKIARIGFLTPASLGPRAELVEGLRAHGYVEGQNIAFEVRTANNRIERLPALAAELVAAKVDIIVAVSHSAIRAARQATASIPIVMAFWGGEGLIESGLVNSFARPGGNVTGVYMFAAELDAKRFELLREALPAARKIAVLVRSDGMPFTRVRDAALAAGIALHVADQPGPDGYGRVFDSVAKAHDDALLVLSFPRYHHEHRQIVEAAAKRRVPVMYEWGEVARGGGLMAYGPNRQELTRSVANYVDRILKGAKPGDLPVEQPTTFEFVVNLKTAKALGVTIPESILLRADEVIR